MVEKEMAEGRRGDGAGSGGRDSAVAGQEEEEGVSSVATPKKQNHALPSTSTMTTPPIEPTTPTAAPTPTPPTRTSWSATRGVETGHEGGEGDGSPAPCEGGLGGNGDMASKEAAADGRHDGDDAGGGGRDSVVTGQVRDEGCVAIPKKTSHALPSTSTSTTPPIAPFTPTRMSWSANTAMWEEEETEAEKAKLHRERAVERAARREALSAKRLILV